MARPDASGRRIYASQFVRFALVGAVGFVVDALALTAAMTWFGFGLYGGRVISYMCAATFTWAANRAFTFPNAADRSPARQWARFLAANAVGAGINYGTYAAMVGYISFVASWPVIGIACGSLAGLVFNFTISRRWVFAAKKV